MPELPEVETIKNQLISLKINGLKINQYYRSAYKLRNNNSYPFSQIINSKIVNLQRRARYLIVDLSNGFSLIFHFGMSGTLNYASKFDSETPKHQHFAIELSKDVSNNKFGNQNWLIFRDPRRFGFVDLLKTTEINSCKYFLHFGPEPLQNNFDANYLSNKIAKDQRPIKTAIMDNNVVVGVGNIYANESLFIAKILPHRTAKNLTIKDAKLLVEAIKKTLAEAIKAGGSSISDFTAIDGNYGNFQNNFKIYDKKDKPCLVCQNIIKKIVIAGRATFFCDKCQK